MWLSNKHKALFIHPIKTAGTSIEVALEVCGENCFKVFKNHATITDAEYILNLNLFFKFSSVRNPWDWEVSHYHWILQQHKIDPNRGKNPAYDTVSKYDCFDDYVKNCLGIGIVKFDDQTSYLIDKSGKIAVDKLIKYENLEQDFISACSSFMSEDELDRVRLKHFLKTEREHYKEYYSKESKEIIEKLRSEDIKNFNYQY